MPSGSVTSGDANPDCISRPTLSVMPLVDFWLFHFDIRLHVFEEIHHDGTGVQWAAFDEGREGSQQAEYMAGGTQTNRVAYTSEVYGLGSIQVVICEMRKTRRNFPCDLCLSMYLFIVMLRNNVWTDAPSLFEKEKPRKNVSTSLYKQLRMQKFQLYPMPSVLYHGYL